MAKTKPEAKKAWKKGGGGFGPVFRPLEAGGAGEPARLPAQERATREIRKYQKDGGYLISRTAFLRLTREVFNKVTRGTGVVRMQQSAIDGLQMIAETQPVALAFNSKHSFKWHTTLSYAADRYKAAGQFAAHAGRKTVTVRDFDVLRNVLLTIDSGSSGTPGFLPEVD